MYKRDDAGKGLVVITLHNTKQYQVDGIDFDKTPKNHFFTWKNAGGAKQETNLVDYFWAKYKIDLGKKGGQPMLYMN